MPAGKAAAVAAAAALGADLAKAYERVARGLVGRAARGVAPSVSRPAGLLGPTLLRRAA